MKVLVACEFSGIVREAFRSEGHDAWSCDLLPTEIPGQHILGDVREYLRGDWDLLIAHPPCTYLSSSGMHWTTRGLRDPAHTEAALEFVSTLLNAPIERICLENPVGVISSRIRKFDQAIQPWWFGDDASKKTCLWLKNLPKLRIDDREKICPPKGYELVRFPDEMTSCGMCDEAYCLRCDDHFSECSCIGSGEEEVIYRSIGDVLFGTTLDPAPKPVWGNQTPSGQNKLGPSGDRWKERSRTYPGIAQAMAKQWGTR